MMQIISIPREQQRRGSTRCQGCRAGMPLLPRGSSYHTSWPGEEKPEHFNGSLQLLCMRKPHYRLLWQ